MSGPWNETSAKSSNTKTDSSGSACSNPTRSYCAKSRRNSASTTWPLKTLREVLATARDANLSVISVAMTLPTTRKAFRCWYANGRAGCRKSSQTRRLALSKFFVADFHKYLIINECILKQLIRIHTSVRSRPPPLFITLGAVLCHECVNVTSAC
jgi:hypothetical protein